VIGANKVKRDGLAEVWKPAPAPIRLCMWLSGLSTANSPPKSLHFSLSETLRRPGWLVRSGFEKGGSQRATPFSASLGSSSSLFRSHGPGNLHIPASSPTVFSDIYAWEYRIRESFEDLRRSREKQGDAPIGWPVCIASLSVPFCLLSFSRPCLAFLTVRIFGRRYCCLAESSK
jgi:hypothetical protein